MLEEQRFGAVAGASFFIAERDEALESAYLAQAKQCAFRIEPAEAVTPSD